jgi:hypothetical protein
MTSEVAGVHGFRRTGLDQLPLPFGSAKPFDDDEVNLGAGDSAMYHSHEVRMNTRQPVHGPLAELERHYIRFRSL